MKRIQVVRSGFSAESVMAGMAVPPQALRACAVCEGGCIP